MPVYCSVCKSNRRAEIDAALVSGGTYRKIAKEFSCSPAAIFRHKTHLAQKLAVVQQHLEILTADNLLGEIAALKSRLMKGVDQAETARSPAAFVAFAREVRQCLESYFDMSERIAASRTQAGANNDGLADRIAAARRRVAEKPENDFNQ